MLAWSYVNSRTNKHYVVRTKIIKISIFYTIYKLKLD